MGQGKRFNISRNDNNSFKAKKRHRINQGLENVSTFFAVQNSMGKHYTLHQHSNQQSAGNILSFFNRLGGYSVYNILSDNKKMGTFIIILANCFGLYLFVYWLMVDYAGIKVFLTSVGVLLYGGMKLYEKYLDLKKKRREDINAEESIKLHTKK